MNTQVLARSGTQAVGVFPQLGHGPEVGDTLPPTSPPAALPCCGGLAMRSAPWACTTQDRRTMQDPDQSGASGESVATAGEGEQQAHTGPGLGFRT